MDWSEWPFIQANSSDAWMQSYKIRWRPHFIQNKRAFQCIHNHIEFLAAHAFFHILQKFHSTVTKLTSKNTEKESLNIKAIWNRESQTSEDLKILNWATRIEMRILIRTYHVLTAATPLVPSWSCLCRLSSFSFSFLNSLSHFSSASGSAEYGPNSSSEQSEHKSEENSRR